VVDRPFDLHTSWPWRVVVIRNGESTRLVLSILHHVADGAGALCVVEELGRNLVGAEAQPERRQIEEEGGRDGGQLFRALSLRELPGLVRHTLKEYLVPALSTPFLSRTAPAGPDTPPEKRRQRYHLLELDVSRDSAVRCRSRKAGCTVNDALVAALAMLNRSLSERGILGNIFTVNLRRYLHDGRPRVANLSGIVFLPIPRSEAPGFEGAAAAVARRTRQQKQAYIGLPTVLPTLLYAWAIPHAALRAMGRRLLWIISKLAKRGLVVTNVGPMDPYLAPMGDMVKSAKMIGPFARNLAVPTLTATSFRGRMTVAFNGYDDMGSGKLLQFAKLLERHLCGAALARASRPGERAA